jgi:glycosyltransferase involved in cell wall biosynthesis
VKRVLFLSYHFPPVGGAGVQRSVKFVRHLPEFGYHPAVVTGPGAGAGRWTPEDPSLAAEVAADLEVERLPDAPPLETAGPRRRAERLLQLPSPFRRWWVSGAVAAGRRQPRPDVIYASMSPFETATAAARLSQELGAPWIADLRDPWALDENAPHPSAVHRWLARRQMARVLSTAAAVVMNTEEAARVARQMLGGSRSRVVAIPNGYDASDFTGPAPAPDTRVLSIVHTGYLHTEIGLRHRRTAGLRARLGGTERGVDFLPRSHVYILRALERLIAEHPDARSRMRLRLAGVLSPTDLEVIAASAHPDIVDALGYVPHSESVDLVRSAGLLFLPMYDLPPGRRARIVPGKAYEYLASSRPILAAVPDGDARELMEAADRAYVCRPTDVEGMASAIAAELDRPADDRAAPAEREALITRYERRRLTARLAEVLDDVLRDAGGAVRG